MNSIERLAASGAPAEWVNHWAGMVNTGTLYGYFKPRFMPFGEVKVRIAATGQLGNDGAANNAIAYHMYNHFPGRAKFWKYVRWTFEPDGAPTDCVKLAGTAPEKFDIYDYVPRR